jgi:hypothetical protein
MSEVASVSAASRFVACDSKAMKRPPEAIDGNCDAALPFVPAVARLTSVVLPLTRSCTNTSGVASVSPPARFVATESNAT